MSTDTPPPQHVVGQFCSWSDGERFALGLVIDNDESPTSHKIVVFRWGAWPQRQALSEPPREAVCALTVQQVAVMWRVVDGKSNPEIGKELGLNPGTIKFHVKNAARKLGCTSREEAATRFLSQGATR